MPGSRPKPISDKLERLCRYICRPPISEKRLFHTPRGDIRYSLRLAGAIRRRA